jgi:hypothetical protein
MQCYNIASMLEKQNLFLIFPNSHGPMGLNGTHGESLMNRFFCIFLIGLSNGVDVDEQVGITD